MAPQHIRYCTHCAHTRFAGCSTTCHIPAPDWINENWRDNPAYSTKRRLQAAREPITKAGFCYTLCQIQRPPQ